MDEIEQFLGRCRSRNGLQQAVTAISHRNMGRSDVANIDEHGKKKEHRRSKKSESCNVIMKLRCILHVRGKTGRKASQNFLTSENPDHVSMTKHYHRMLDGNMMKK